MFADFINADDVRVFQLSRRLALELVRVQIGDPAERARVQLPMRRMEKEAGQAFV